MNVVIITECQTNADIRDMVETLRSVPILKCKANIKIIGNFHPELIDQLPNDAIPFPKTTMMGYLNFLIQDQKYSDDEWILLMKSGDLLLKNPFDIILDPECDGFVGLQYVGVKQTFSNLSKYIEENDLLIGLGFSGTAIRVKFLKKFFEFYDQNEFYFFQFIEKLSNSGFLSSPVTYQSQPIPLGDDSGEKSLTLLEKFDLGEQILEKLKNLPDLISKLEESQRELILAYKDNREFKDPNRDVIFNKLVDNLDSILAIIVDNNLT
jgi:hypothetical protein